MTRETHRPQVFFNGSCPICGWEIGHYRKLAGADQIEWIDLTDKPDALIVFGIDRKSAKRRLYSLDGDGALKDGVDTFELIWSRLPRYRWLTKITATAVGRRLAEFSYNRVAVPVLARLNGLHR